MRTLAEILHRTPTGGRYHRHRKVDRYNWAHVIARLEKRARPRPYRSIEERKAKQGITQETQDYLMQRAAARGRTR